MTSEEFIKWIDEEIAEADRLIYKATLECESSACYEARSNALWEVKEKYLSILPPTTIN